MQQAFVSNVFNGVHQKEELQHNNSYDLLVTGAEEARWYINKLFYGVYFEEKKIAFSETTR